MILHLRPVMVVIIMILILYWYYYFDIIFLVAVIILSFYYRPGEKLYTRIGSAWMLGCRSRSEVAGTSPIANLVFNFRPPASEDQPVLLTFDDVNLLFQKVIFFFLIEYESKGF